jgi:hypothetical protein
VGITRLSDALSSRRRRTKRPRPRSGAAELVDEILRDAGNIPVEQPTKLDLAIHLATAEALGLAIPSDVLALADTMIESASGGGPEISC